MAKIVVTGGGGFLKPATRYPLDAGQDVTVLDYFHQYPHPVQPTFPENTNWRLTQLLKELEVQYTSTIHKDGTCGAISSNCALTTFSTPLRSAGKPSQSRQTEEASRAS